MVFEHNLHHQTKQVCFDVPKTMFFETIRDWWYFVVLNSPVDQLPKRHHTFRLGVGHFGALKIYDFQGIGGISLYETLSHKNVLPSNMCDCQRVQNHLGCSAYCEEII